MHLFRSILFVICLFVKLNYGCAQEPSVIKIKKETNLTKAVFDNVDLKLMVVDRFGNPRENSIMSYKLWIKAKGYSAPLSGFGNNLTNEMVKELNKLKKAAKLFFTEITVKDDDGHLITLPDVIDTWFPSCKKNQ